MVAINEEEDDDDTNQLPRNNNSNSFVFNSNRSPTTIYIRYVSKNAFGCSE